MPGWVLGGFARNVPPNKKSTRRMNMYHPFPEDRAKAIERAQLFLNRDSLFLDTKTTGLSDMDEICEIAIIDARGDVLINSLVKPTKPIDPNTSAIHGITNEMVAHVPTFRDLLPQLEQVLRGREVVVYNSAFDEGKIYSSARANGMDMNQVTGVLGLVFADPSPVEGAEPEYRSRWHCAMELYAMFYGDWNDYHQSYRWQRLTNAALQCGIELPLGTHRALNDAELTRRIMMHVADAKPTQITMFE
jgi:DNA polymerase-3 subunit epsilon